MRYRLSRFAVHQTALTVAACYGLLALLITPIIYFASRMSPQESLPGMLIILLPVLYAVFGYIFTAIACWFYNLVAGWAGGIEFTLEARTEAVP